MRFFSHAHYQFIEQRKKAYVVSAAVISVGILFMVLNIVNLGSWLNYGVDFTGGSLVQVRFNTEMSAGGWPAVLGDGEQGSIFHSFYSDDFIVWEPWDIGGACNYFISVYAELGAFDNTTWGALKTTF